MSAKFAKAPPAHSHSNTLPRPPARHSVRKVVECGCPLPLFSRCSRDFLRIKTLETERIDCLCSLPTIRTIKTTIREAKLADAEIIADFNARMALETEQRSLDIERVRQGVKALLSDPTKGLYFVVEIETGGVTTIIGQLLITYEWSDWRNGNFWWIQSVYVAEKFRGQGIFRALYNHVDSLAKARTNVCGLRLYVDADNTSARKTYQRLGMKRTNYELFETDFVLKGH